MLYYILIVCSPSVIDSCLQLAHGADPAMKNQEGQTPLDLATVRNVQKSLLSDINNGFKGFIHKSKYTLCNARGLVRIQWVHWSRNTC